MKTNEILENIKARRSVRAYTGQQVSEEDLQAVLEAATYAPSGMHLETEQDVLLLLSCSYFGYRFQ